jgi:hypothetical protein
LETVRAIEHAQVVCHITRVIQNGSLVSGWRCTTPNSLAERDMSEHHGVLRGTNDYGDDMLEVINGEIVAKPLGRPLEYVSPNLVCD